MWYGCAHVAGLYPNRSASLDFFNYGVNLIKGIGFRTLKVYISTGYAGRDYVSQSWGTAPTSLLELAQKPAMTAAFSDSQFDRIVISAFSFNQPNNAWALDPGMAPPDYNTEYKQTYDLACHFLTTYPGKEFIIKNWEGDWQMMGNFSSSNYISPERIKQYTAYHAARQRGVRDARRDVRSTAIVNYAIECNRVLDDNAERVHSSVVPSVKPDMVSLSIYEAIEGWLYGMSQSALEADIESKLTTVVRRVRNFVPNDTPVIIGEFGWPIDEPTFSGSNYNVGALIQKVIDVGDALNVKGSIYWQILDNEERSSGVPRGFGLYTRSGSSSVVGPISATGTKYYNIFNPTPPWSNSNSVVFNGTSNYINYGQPAAIVGVNHNTTQRTYSLWARNNAAVLDATFMAVAEQSNRPLQIYSVSGLPTAYVGTNFMQGSTAMTSGTWYHIVVRTNGNGTTNLIVNGTTVASTTAGTAAQAYDLLMGCRRNSGNTGTSFIGNNHFNVDEVTVWNTGLTNAAVTALYNGGVPTDPTTHVSSSNLVHYWRMGEGSTYPTINDSKGSSNGTMTNMSAGNIVIAHA